MRIKWGKRSFTFLIIPNAARKVVRFRISALLLYLIPIAALSIVCLTLALHVKNLSNTIEKNRLAAELADRTQQFEQTLKYKDTTITSLEDEIVNISAKTEEMKLMVDKLKMLEEEIRDVTEGTGEGSVGQTSAAKNVAVLSAESPPSTLAEEGMDETKGIGGETIEIDSDQAAFLIAHTKSNLNTLDIEVSSLIASITSAKDDLIAHMRRMRITPSIWPTTSKDISSTFGYRKDPFTRRGAFHAGIDIAGNTGDPVYATAEGIVTSAGYDRSYGYNIIIKHASGVSTRYGHMKKLLVKDGHKVSQGEKIGLLGSTGRSTGPHLHYEVIRSGDTINPMPYLKSAEGNGN